MAINNQNVTSMRSTTTRIRGPYSVAFWGGVLGALTMTVIMLITRALGWTAINLEITLGSMFTRSITTGSWILGFFIHLILGGLFAMAYAWGFLRRNRTGSGEGAMYGVAHWIAGGIFLGIVPGIHPLIPEVVPAQGIFALNLNFFSVVAWLGLHLIYGAIVGSVYKNRVIKEQRIKVSEEPRYRRSA